MTSDLLGDSLQVRHAQRRAGDVMSASPRVPLLSLQQISVRFDAVEALVGVDLDVFSHQVVALVGDNGAGKSTLAKVIAGVLTPDSGLIEIDGEQVTIPTPSAAHALGIATVFQDLALCSNLDVTSNIFLGRELTDGGLLDDGRMEQAARAILQDLTLRIPSVRMLLWSSRRGSARRWPSRAPWSARRASSSSTSRPPPCPSRRPPRCSPTSSGCETWGTG